MAGKPKASRRSVSTRAVTALPSDDMVRARINRKVKKEAIRVLAQVGLTPSSAYRLMMFRIAQDKALPFELHMPNAKTEEALKAAAAGKVTMSNTVDELFEDLNADD
jgi:DNA-damage-inducible protein J